MSLNKEADELLRATKQQLAATETKLKLAHTKIVRQDAEDAITRSGASSPGILAHNMSAAGRVSEDGRSVEYNLDGRWVSRETYLSALRHDANTSKFFAGTTPKKTTQLSETNPFSKRHWNLTEQMRIIRGDPDRAAALRREAE